MKNLAFILTIIINIYGYNSIFSQDQWISNIPTRSEHHQPSPYCIAYDNNANLYYVYTGQKILIINKSSRNIINHISVSQTGFLSDFYNSINLTHKIYFDQDQNYLYCANEEDKLQIFDCGNNYSIVHEFQATQCLGSSFIYFNPSNDVLYWVQNPVTITSGNAKLVAINPANQSIIGNYQPEYESEIIDLAFCNPSGNIAISIKYGSGGSIRLLNPFDLNLIDTYSFTNICPGNLQYISEAYRLYCVASGPVSSCLFAFNITSDHINYLTNYSINDFSISRIASSCYNNNDHLLYLVGNTFLDTYKIVIIDYFRQNNENPIISDIDNPFLCQAICPFNDNVYLAGYSLLKLNGTVIENSVDLHGEVCHLIQAGPDLAISDREGDAICTYSNDLELLQNISTGDFVIKGCSNYNRQKLYWLSRSALNPQSALLVQDLSNDSFSSVEIGPNIEEIAYHENSDKVVTLNLTSPALMQLTIIDGLNNQILHETVIDWILHVFPCNNNFSYLGGGNFLKSLNMTNYEILDIPNNPLSIPFHILDFAQKENGNCVVLAIENGEPGCKLLEIEKTTNQIIANHQYYINPLFEGGLKFFEYKNSLMILSVNSISIIDPSTYHVILTIAVSFDTPVTENCYYSAKNDQIFFVTKDNENIYNIQFYNASSGEFLREIILSPFDQIISSIFNPNNDLLYLHTLNYDRNLCINKVGLLSYSAENYQQTSNLYFWQNHIKNEFSYRKGNMQFTKFKDILYIPNQGLGNISKVECPPDKIPLQARVWNWISIPRLDQANSPVPAQPMLEEIQMFPDTLRMTNVPLNPVYSSVFIRNWLGVWSGNLNEVQSTFGYKLKHSEPTTCYLPMVGQLPDPATTFTIYPGHENWVGYFLPETQSPFDAIPASVLSNLKSIKAQYWSCLNYAFITPPPYKSSASSTGEWRCLCNQGNVEIAYNDMVVFTMGNPVQQTFAWHQSGGGSAINEKDAPEFFNYNEKADYESIFIELDTTNRPDEIGAFAGDSCIGATKVLPGDSAVMICAYNQGFEGEEITFELLYSTKAARPVIDDYQVLNTQTRIMENRKITVGENQSFYLVSLKNRPENKLMSEPLWMHVSPNPANNETEVTYFLADDSWVKIGLSNVLGKEIINWEPGMQNAGEHRFKFSVSHLPTGYYLVKMLIGNQTIAEKMLVIH